jgi:hypothetical protein
VGKGFGKIGFVHVRCHAMQGLAGAACTAGRTNRHTARAGRRPTEWKTALLVGGQCPPVGASRQLQGEGCRS